MNIYVYIYLTLDVYGILETYDTSVSSSKDGQPRLDFAPDPVAACNVVGDLRSQDLA